jgi:hypothetical protein
MLALIGLLTMVTSHGNRASGAGTLVVIEDASQLGTGSFSGNVCYSVIRDRDGVTISEGCFSIAAAIAAPEGLDTTERYSIVVYLADAHCVLLEDPRTGNGTEPFVVRVSCDAAYVTVPAGADEGQSPDPIATGTASSPADPTQWPPVYDEPETVTTGGSGGGDPVPMASPIPIPSSR